MQEAWREKMQSGLPLGVGERASPPQSAASEARAALHGDIVVDLGNREAIAVTGPDARALLQGQLTNDIEAVDESHTQLSAWCSIKGRVLVLFRIWQRGETLHLELPTEARDAIAARLRMYVLRARVSIANAARDLVRFGVAGARVTECLAEAYGPLPAQPDTARRFGECTLIRLRGDRPRFQVIAPIEAAHALWERCLGVSASVAVPAWDLLDIRAGVPSLSPAQSDLFLPQSLHLEQVNGLCFDKGCYAGQEIIARTQYLGRLKRHMYRAVLHDTEAAVPGDAIFTAETERHGSVGQVLNVAPSEGDGRWELLAVIEDAAAKGELRLRHPLGPSLLLLPLPRQGKAHTA